MNLSFNELSAQERNGLEKDLNFAIAPSKISTAEIVAAVEESISQFHDDRRHSRTGFEIKRHELPREYFLYR